MNRTSRLSTFLAVAGLLVLPSCGGSDEVTWESEFRETRTADFQNELEPLEALVFCNGIAAMSSSQLEEALISEGLADEEYIGSGRSLPELLSAFGEEYTTANVKRAVEIFVEVLEDSCSDL